MNDLGIKKIPYWAIFDIEVNVGISRENIPKNTCLECSGLGLSFSGYNSDTIIIKEGEYKLFYKGWGINAGIALQFYRSKQIGNQSVLKRSFKLGFIWHQGLNDRVIRDYSIQRNSEPMYHFKLISRGSYFGMYLAYPIKLFGIKSKKQKSS